MIKLFLKTSDREPGAESAKKIGLKFDTCRSQNEIIWVKEEVLTEAK